MSYRNLDRETLQAYLAYDSETGVFTWRPRIVTETHHRVFNERHAGERAGTADDRGYRHVILRHGGERYLIREHRLAFLFMTGAWPVDEVDHRNLDKGDNRWSNLRHASPSQNGGNVLARRRNTSGRKGVNWAAGRWVAKIQAQGVQHHLGRFDDLDEAAAAYQEAAARLHGEFARA